MAADVEPPKSDQETTKPPIGALRFPTPGELYLKVPEVLNLTLHRPQPDETVLNYLYRLRASTTPEEAVTFTAFAARPIMGVWWGYECLRVSSIELSMTDRQIVELVANWTRHPYDENRFRVMKLALYAPVRSAAVHLGLAVGWSGGAIAPNDPAPVPVDRAARALNTAVLSCLTQTDLQSRSIRLARFIDQAATMFQGH